MLTYQIKKDRQDAVRVSCYTIEGMIKYLPEIKTFDSITHFIRENNLEGKGNIELFYDNVFCPFAKFTA